MFWAKGFIPNSLEYFHLAGMWEAQPLLQIFFLVRLLLAERFQSFAGKFLPLRAKIYLRER
jgi:hypothetical protein